MTYRQPRSGNPRKRSSGEQRRLVIRSVRYRELDAKKFARALIQMATAEAEAQALAEHEARSTAEAEPAASPTEASPPKEVA